MSTSSSCCGGSGCVPGIGRADSIAAKDCAVGTSTNSPFGSALSHLRESSLMVQRQVRSIWQWRYHGVTTVTDFAEHVS
eukprot:5476595-Prymnesium_polylepis.2